MSELRLFLHCDMISSILLNSWLSLLLFWMLFLLKVGLLVLECFSGESVICKPLALFEFCKFA